MFRISSRITDEPQTKIHRPTANSRSKTKRKVSRVNSDHVTSNHVTSDHVTSNHVTSNHVTVDHVTIRIQSLAKRKERHITQVLAMEEECDLMNETDSELEFKIECIQAKHQELLNRYTKMVQSSLDKIVDIILLQS